MKSIISTILLALFSTCSFGQIVNRYKGENKDSLIARVLEKNAIKVGKTYELKEQSASIIIYFEIKVQDNLQLDKNSKAYKKNFFSEFEFSPFTGRETVTLFKVMFSMDGINYTNHVVDTLDKNSGCCPCHLPDVVESILFLDKNSNNDLILLLTHPVRFDCNSATSYKALFYKNFVTNLNKNKFSIRPFASFYRSDAIVSEVEYSEMVKYFKEKK